VTREELEHAVRSACDVAGDTEVWVFGSQAILGEYPDAPAALRMSVEVDMMPKNRPDRIDAIDGALGELSPFHAAFGFYVHGVSLESAILPAGWKARTVVVRNRNTRNHSGLCIEAHDLAASKLAAFREKDRDFVRVLLSEEMIKARKLIQRLRRLTLASDRIQMLVTWVGATVRELPGRR
jgi:hypothetical protein